MNIVALIMAAGIGARFSENLPKQYTKLREEYILKLTILKFLNHEKIDAVRVVINPAHHQLYQQVISDVITSKLIAPISGGKERQDSVREGLRSLVDMNPEFILVHDAVRPFVGKVVIDRVIEKLNEFEAVDTGLDIYDTLKSKQSAKVYDRDKFYLTHTPQAFKFNTILNLHEKYKNQKFTDDITLCAAENIKIGLVQSNKENIKITTIDCLPVSEMKPSYIQRVGYGFDTHRFEEASEIDNFIKLCAVKVPFSKSLSAHSDGDVALHALTDALLGAMGEEDIGMYFPSHDMKWRKADSTLFLKHAYKLLIERQGNINNIDITIITEAPKLMNFKQLMKEKIAQLLNLSSNQVSIKAKTSEKLGFIGRGEGISVAAICAIVLPITFESRNAIL